MQEPQRSRRRVEELTGRVVWVSEPTGVKIEHKREWLNRPRQDFEGCTCPQRDQIWWFKCEVVEKADGDILWFVREERYIETVESQPVPLVQEVLLERPSFEDAEWFWAIKDERGGVINETYQSYLASPAWARRRDLRLALDQHRCQANLPGCTTAATQVHHKNYFHLGCEPMWDLESACGNCHTLLTSMDKRLPRRDSQAA